MLRTELCDLLGIQHPILLAGMNSVSTSELAAAVSNAGGFGNIGGQSFQPKALRQELQELTDLLKEKGTDPRNFGVDLLIPQVGDGARKTNYDYSDGKLPELIDIICEYKAKLFICAVGVPPKWAVEKLHAHNVLVMNMVGSVRNCEKALAAGADLICAQGHEAGGHTGDIASSVLVPQCVDLCRKWKRRNYNNSADVLVVGAGGVFDGRGLASMLALGASGVWVGTRFVCTEESHAPKHHKEKIMKAKAADTIRTLYLTGRPLRVIPNAYLKEKEKDQERIRKLLADGQIPVYADLSEDTGMEKYRLSALEISNSLAGQAAGAIEDVLPAREVVEGMVKQAAEVLQFQMKNYLKGSDDARTSSTSAVTGFTSTSKSGNSAVLRGDMAVAKETGGPVVGLKPQSKL
ncbi:unnamed protein product [Amoebophrya sp. A120]|nr:unnamed protein product [Amoebophrya sp. A120]|eukprot:GSA120T00021552001.1